MKTYEISLNLPELFIIGKYVNRGSPIFSVLEINRSKILQKINKSDYFCLHSWLHF